MLGRMEKPESGIRNRSRNRNRNRNLNWDQGKLGSTETSSRYPCGNKIQDGVLCYHCFEKFSAQWLWYQRYTHIRKVTCKKKAKCILLLFLAVILTVTTAVGRAIFDRSRLQLAEADWLRKAAMFKTAVLFISFSWA